MEAAAIEMEEERLSRKGTTYRKLMELPGLAESIEDGSNTIHHVAELLSVTPAAVSRAMGAWRIEQGKLESERHWVMGRIGRAQIAIPEFDLLHAAGLQHEHTQGFQFVLEQAARKFWLFEHRHFTIGSRGERFIRKLFHETIVKELIIAHVFAERALILTPPRHGKSEIVLRFCAWLIVMYPNIQILWVAANKPLAIIMTRKLKGVFTHTESLRRDFLPPGRKFLDDKAPKYTEDEFITYTRTDHTLKSATFTALGSAATVAGRDADFIGVDDLEERKTVATKELRDKSKEKHSEIMERQEDHTGVVTIGSRQHIDDIPASLMVEDDPELSWRIHVFSAHDAACPHDPTDLDAHVDCMLLPEVRDYRWLMRMEKEAADLGLPGRFPLRYLQIPVAAEGMIFDIPLIRKVCLDHSRGLGDPPGISGRKIAGLDPAARGTQAAFGWMWTPETLYMLDLEMAEGGGVLGAVDVMGRWLDAYDMREWIHEENSGQIDAWKHVPAYAEFLYNSPINIRPHTTGGNKHDPESGISSMSAWYHRAQINLPYGTPDARRKVNILLGQLELWTDDGLNKRGKSDVKMASWLPFPRIVKWQWDYDDIDVQVSSESSYTGYGETQYAPWGQTPYPGG